MNFKIKLLFLAKRASEFRAKLLRTKNFKTG